LESRFTAFSFMISRWCPFIGSPSWCCLWRTINVTCVIK